MKRTRYYFESSEVGALTQVVSDLVKELDSQGASVDEEKRRALTVRVLKIASRGITDPQEIRELILAR